MDKYQEQMSLSLDSTTFYYKLTPSVKTCLSKCKYNSVFTVAYSKENWIEEMETYLSIFETEEKYQFSPGDVVYLRFLKQECRELCGLFVEDTDKKKSIVSFKNE